MKKLFVLAMLLLAPISMTMIVNPPTVQANYGTYDQGYNVGYNVGIRGDLTYSPSYYGKTEEWFAGYSDGFDVGYQQYKHRQAEENKRQHPYYRGY